MTMGLIMYLYSDKVLRNPNLTTAQKIEKIKEKFSQSAALRFDETTGRYFEANLDGFFSEEDRKKYIEKTKGLAINLGGRCGWTLLGVAAQHGDLGIIKWLIEEQGANINLGNEFGHTPLLIATSEGQIGTMRYLISQGADINLAVTHCSGDSATGGTGSGETPLHQAVRYGQVEAAKVLVGSGALIKKAGRFNPIQYGYFLLPILSDLEKGIEHANADVFGNQRWRDMSKVPSQSSIKAILQLLELHYKYQAFVRTTLSEIYENDTEKDVKRDNEESSLALAPLIDEDYKASIEFIHLLRAKNKVVNQLQKKTKIPIPTDCEMRILTFLYGDFDRYRGISRRIATTVDPEKTAASSASASNKITAN